MRDQYPGRCDDRSDGKKPITEVRRGFTQRLKAARISAGFPTARAFARELGFEEARVSAWERGESEPDIANLGRISRLLGVSLDVLLTGQRPVMRFEQDASEGQQASSFHTPRDTFTDKDDPNRSA